MRKEAIKELGKFILDLSKILIAVVVVAPFVKGGNLEIFPIVVSAVTSSLGMYLINKGAKDD